MRKYQIINNTESPIAGYIAININQLDKIINNSADYVLSTGLEYISEDKNSKIIRLLLDKLKLGGRLIIEVHDIKKICLDFINSQINNETFLKYIKNKTNIIGIDDILAVIDANFTKIIDQHHKSEYIYSITIERIGI